MHKPQLLKNEDNDLAISNMHIVITEAMYAWVLLSMALFIYFFNIIKL